MSDDSKTATVMAISTTGSTFFLALVIGVLALIVPADLVTQRIMEGVHIVHAKEPKRYDNVSEIHSSEETVATRTVVTTIVLVILSVLGPVILTVVCCVSLVVVRWYVHTRLTALQPHTQPALSVFTRKFLISWWPLHLSNTKLNKREIDLSGHCVSTGFFTNLKRPRVELSAQVTRENFQGSSAGAGGGSGSDTLWSVESLGNSGQRALDRFIPVSIPHRVNARRLRVLRKYSFAAWCTQAREVYQGGRLARVHQLYEKTCNNEISQQQRRPVESFPQFTDSISNLIQRTEPLVMTTTSLSSVSLDESNARTTRNFGLTSESIEHDGWCIKERGEKSAHDLTGDEPSSSSLIDMYSVITQFPALFESRILSTWLSAQSSESSVVISPRASPARLTNVNVWGSSSRQCQVNDNMIDEEIFIRRINENLPLHDTSGEDDGTMMVVTEIHLRRRNGESFRDYITRLYNLGILKTMTWDNLSVDEQNNSEKASHISSTRSSSVESTRSVIVHRIEKRAELADILEQFLQRYESARFSCKPLKSQEFNILINEFAKVLTCVTKKKGFIQGNSSSNLSEGRRNRSQTSETKGNTYESLRFIIND